MTQYDYMIAGNHLRMITDEPLVQNWQTELFLCDASEPDLTVRVHVTEDLPCPSGTKIETGWETRLYLQSDGFWQETINRKDGTALFTARVPQYGDPEIWAQRKNLPHTVRSWVLWSAMDLPYLLLQRGVMMLHSASVERNGKAILFVAPSQTGKSTQARLWHQHRGAVQLNGDKNCIAMREGKAFAMGTPFSGTSEICAAYTMPLEAIVILRQAPVNSARRLQGMQAVLPLLENSFGHRTVPGCLNQMMSILSGVAGQVPVFEFSCTPDERAVVTLESVLDQEV